MPVPPKDARCLKGGGATSSTLETLKRVFGHDTGRIHLEQKDVATLRAMSEVSDGWGAGCYKELADEIEQHDAIEVWGEW
jgi:hypothetical protein